jgi:histidinol-phosphate aminotransferase
VTKECDMPLSRRAFLRLVPDDIRISNNENPLGPGPRALEAIFGKYPEAGRYPFNSTPSDADLVEAIAAAFAVTREHVVVGAGSQELLRSAVRAWVRPGRALVTGRPTFENCTTFARKQNLPVVEVDVDAALRLDVDGMADAAERVGAGLVFFNNPNNPTGTVHAAQRVADMVERLHRASPATVILVDEAYHDYVTDPSYRTTVPLALATRNVIVTRTFSKAYGMAGLRVGYAIGRPDTIAPLAALALPYNVSVPAIAAAITSLGDPQHIADERSRNTAVRDFTVKTLVGMGARPVDTQTNFVFSEIGMPAKDFREACAKQGVLVGRDFPPFEKTHCRISIGTMDEMRRATDVFRTVLRPAVASAGR